MFHAKIYPYNNKKQVEFIFLRQQLSFTPPPPPPPFFSLCEKYLFLQWAVDVERWPQKAVARGSGGSIGMSMQ